MLLDFICLIEGCTPCIKLITSFRIFFIHFQSTRSVCTHYVELTIVICLLIIVEFLECMKFYLKREKVHTDLKQVSNSFSHFYDCIIFSIIFVIYSYE